MPPFGEELAQKPAAPRDNRLGQEGTSFLTLVHLGSSCKWQGRAIQPIPDRDCVIRGAAAATWRASGALSSSRHTDQHFNSSGASCEDAILAPDPPQALITSPNAFCQSRIERQDAKLIKKDTQDLFLLSSLSCLSRLGIDAPHGLTPRNRSENRTVVVKPIVPSDLGMANSRRPHPSVSSSDRHGSSGGLIGGRSVYSSICRGRILFYAWILKKLRIMTETREHVFNCAFFDRESRTHGQHVTLSSCRFNTEQGRRATLLSFTLIESNCALRERKEMKKVKKGECYKVPYHDCIHWFGVHHYLEIWSCVNHDLYHDQAWRGVPQRNGVLR